MISNATKPTEDVIAALGELGAATVHEAQGKRGALCSAIKPIDSQSRLAGRALTIEAAPADNLVIHFALLKARPGDVLVIDAKGFVEAGPWGDILTEAAVARGVKGLVIDGAVRDAATITQMQFPVFCRGLSIKGTEKNQPGRVGQPISLGGVLIQSGDVIIGDRDGVVVVPAGDAEAVLKKARERADKEESFRQAIREGRTTVELLGLESAVAKLDLD